MGKVLADWNKNRVTRALAVLDRLHQEMWF